MHLNLSASAVESKLKSIYLFISIELFSVMPSKIRLGSLVSGLHGELFTPMSQDDGNKRKRHQRKRLFGQVVFSVGPNEWRVLWDNGKHGNYKSNTLRYEREGPPLVERGIVVRNRRVLDGNTDTNAYETSSNTVSQHALPPMYTPHPTIDMTTDNPLAILADASDILGREGETEDAVITTAAAATSINTNNVTDEGGEEEEMHHPDQEQHEDDLPGFDFYFDNEYSEECRGEFWHEMHRQSQEKLKALVEAKHTITKYMDKRKI